MPIKDMTAIAVVAAAISLVAFSLGLVYAGSHPGRPAPRPATPTASKPDPAPATRPAKVPERSAAEARSRPDEGIIALGATVEPSETVEVLSDVAGHIGRIAVDIGSPVLRGDILAEIDAPGLKLELAKADVDVQQARARIATARARAKVADAAVQTARAELESSQAELKQTEANSSYRRRQYDRIAELVKKGALQNRIGEEEKARIRGDESSEQAARSRVALTRASLLGAEARLEAALAEVAEREEDLHRAEVGREEVRVELESCRIRSPIDGIVTSRLHHAGEFVRSAASGGPDAILKIVQARTVRIVAQVPDRDVPRVSVGVPAMFRPDSPTGHEYRGKISRIAVAEDSSDHTMRAEVDLDNSEGRLRSGQRGTLRIDVEPAP